MTANITVYFSPEILQIILTLEAIFLGIELAA
jgi:hypothetical protein